MLLNKSRTCAVGAIMITAAGANAATLTRAESTSYDPYMEFEPAYAAANPRADLKALRAVEDGTSLGLPQMVGVPDGMGAYDNGDGTFTVLANHELGSTGGVMRSHGQKGSFVSKWTVKKDTLKVLAIQDLIQRVAYWNVETGAFEPASPAKRQFNRFCSANVPQVTAFYNAATGKGTTARALLNGEEGGECSAWMHVATGPDAGTSFQLAHLGRLSFENAVPAPFPQDKTVVVSQDDSSTNNSIVTVYVGEKRAEGNTPERAGLIGGRNYGVQVRNNDGGVVAVENINDNTGVPVSGVKGASADFTLVELPNSDKATSTRGASGGMIGNATLTFFARPEDGAWDPRPEFKNDYYFVCTASTSARCRLYRMRFHDISQPELGGTITAMIDGTEGPRMMDNITVTPKGKIYCQEDPGGNNRYAKLWEFDIATGTLKEVLRFKSTLLAPNGSYFNNDEESSGVIDVSEILGPGRILLNAQVHTSVNGRPIPAENLGEPSAAAEHGQLMLLSIPESVEISRSAPIFNRARTKATQSITVKNTSGAVLNGPVRIAFRELPSGTTLTSPDGTVTVNGTENVPYVIVSSGPLSENETANVDVSFNTAVGSTVTAELSVVE